MFAPCSTDLWTNSFGVSGMQIFFHSLAVFFGFQHSELTLSWIPRPPENQMDERNWEKEPTLFEKGRKGTREETAQEIILGVCALTLGTDFQGQFF